MRIALPSVHNSGSHTVRNGFDLPAAQHLAEELRRIHTVRGVMWARIHAARLWMVVTEVARSCLAHGRLLSSATVRCRELVQVDISVWAIGSAQPATDAPVFDDDFQRVAPPNRSHRTSNHAQRVAALAAGGCNEIILKA